MGAMPAVLRAVPVLLAGAAAVASAPARTAASSTSSRPAFLIDVNRAIRKVSEDANLTFSALDTYGQQLEMSATDAMARAHNATGLASAAAVSAHSAEYAAGVKELRGLESKIRERYAAELARVRKDVEQMGRQIASLQAEKVKAKADMTKIQASVSQAQAAASSQEQRAQAAEERARLAEDRLTAQKQILAKDKADAQAMVSQLEKRATVCEQQLKQAGQQGSGDASSGDATEAEAAEGAAKRELDRIREDGERIAQLKAQNNDLAKERDDLRDRLGAMQGGGASSSAEVPSSARSQALEREVDELKARITSLEGDKTALVGTVRSMMNTNQTKKMATEIQDMSHAEASESQRLKTEEVSWQKKLSDASDKLDDEKEVVKTLQEQGLAAQQEAEKCKASYVSLQKENTVLKTDKEHLLETLRGTLRSNTKYQQELAEDELRNSQHPAQTPQAAAPPPSPPQPQPEALRLEVNDPLQVMGETPAMDRYIHTTKTGAEAIVAAVEPTKAEAEMMADGESRNPQRPAAEQPQRPKSSLRKWLANTPADDPEADAEKTVDADPKDNPDGQFGDAVSKLLNQAEAAVSQAGDDSA